MNAPLFSVIIPTRNRADLLERCLDALTAQNLAGDRFEVIIVDDGSTVETTLPPFPRREEMRWAVVRQDHAGPGRARNTGAAQAMGEVLAFTEDDVIPERDWLRRAAEIWGRGDTDVIEGSTRDERTGMEVRRHDAERGASFIPCNLFIRRSLFQEVGGYATDFVDVRRGIYFREDSDLGFRLMDAGARIVVSAALVVTHPAQFLELASCFRHARRYQFDALLYKRHPRRFRAHIEVKRVMGITVHRPQHYIALGTFTGALAVLGGSVLVAPAMVVAGSALVLAGGSLFQWKYRGRSMLSFRGMITWPAFLALPFVYLFSVLAGCVRYRSYGALL